VETLVGEQVPPVHVPLHSHKEPVLRAWRDIDSLGICKSLAPGASRIMPHRHLLAAPVASRISMARLIAKYWMIRMPDIERHPERLCDPARDTVEVVAYLLRVFFAETLDHPGIPGSVAEIAEWRELHPMVLAFFRGGELIREE
jgi:hypothetical protein